MAWCDYMTPLHVAAESSVVLASSRNKPTSVQKQAVVLPQSDCCDGRAPHKRLNLHSTQQKTAAWTATLLKALRHAAQAVVPFKAWAALI